MRILSKLEILISVECFILTKKRCDADRLLIQVVSLNRIIKSRSLQVAPPAPQKRTVSIV